jgi:hypothetical protein
MRRRLLIGLLVAAGGCSTGSTATTGDTTLTSTPGAVTTSTAPEVPPTTIPDAVPPTGTDLFGRGVAAVSPLTDEMAGGGRGTHEYSQLQAFAPGNTHVLLAETSAGGYVVKRLADLARMPLDTSAWNAPRWHPVRAGTVVHYDSNEDETVRAQLTDVASGAVSTVFTFPDRHLRVRVPQSFDELSRDGRWMAGAVSDAGGGMVIVAVDLEEARLGFERSVADFYRDDCAPDPEWGEVEPDWVGVSPLGRYLVVQWVRDGVERCSGLEAFDLSTGAFAGQVTQHHHHGDLALDIDGGTELFVSTELASVEDNGRPGLVAYPIPPGPPGPREIMALDWGDAAHISCQGPPGWCVITSVGTEGPFSGAVWAVDLQGSTRFLAHHESSSCGYWVQPRASVSADGSFVVFDTDRASGGPSSCESSGDELGRGDAWLIAMGSSD